MFPKNLSNYILRICHDQHKSYEAASELCNISPRYFGALARGQTNASLDTLEKLCHGFNATPNELLGVDTSMKLSFRTPMPVTCLRRAPTLGRYTLFALCPRCNRDIEREYQAFCSNCGQMLDWSMIDDAIIID